MDYYVPFWGPKAISVDVEFQGALTCRSSTLIVLADSGPFHGLLLTFWSPGVMSTSNEPCGAFTCRSSTLAVLADSGPFHGLLLPFLGPKMISILVEPQGVLTCWSSTLAVLADSGPFHGLLLTVLGSQSDFHLSNSKVRLHVGHQQSQFGPIMARFLDYYSILGSCSQFDD